MAKKVALLGVGDDRNSSFLKGAAMAPSLIREQLFSAHSNSYCESGIEVLNEQHLLNVGDCEFTNQLEPFAIIESKIAEITDNDLIPLSIGGDHAITYPIVKAITKHHQPITILHFDAHPDLYDEFEGNRYSHACPFARIMELGTVNRLIQVGIRTLNDHQRQQQQRFGVECYDMNFFDQHELHLQLSGPVYISIDLDCLDPAYAPGVSHREPGGMTSRQVIKILHQVANQNCQLVGADLVEYNPSQDIDNMSAVVSAKLIKELLGLLILKG